MSDYRERTQRPLTGDVGTPELNVRTDRPLDLAGAPFNRAVGQLDCVGGKRITGEGGRITYRPTANFSPDSTGTDVWYIQGSGAVDLQTINTGTRTAGTFTLGVIPYLATAVQTTGPIPFNATAAQVQRALELIVGVGNVYCTGGPLAGTAIKVFFIGQMAGYQALMVLTDNCTGGAWATPISHTTSGWANQQTLTQSGGSAGTFTVSYMFPPTGQVVTTAPIAYTATAAAFQTALNAALATLPNNSANTLFCICGGGAFGTAAVTCIIAGTLNGYNANSDQQVMGYDAGGLTGSTFTITNINARVIKLRKLTVTLVATAAGTGPLKLVRFAPTAVPYAPAGAVLATTNVKNGILDATDPAPTATIKYYTTHPTSAATPADILINEEVGSQAVGTFPISKLEWNFETSIGCKLPRLQGWADAFILNLAAALTGSGVVVTVEPDIIEEPFST